MRHLFWPIAAQVLLSAGQMTLSVIGAVALDAEVWGALALAFSVHYVAVGTITGLSQPVLTWHAGDSAAASAHRSAAVRLQLLAAVPAAAVVATVSVALGIAAVAIPLAAALLGAAVWNAARTVALAAGDFRRAAVGDAAHLAALALGAVGTGAFADQHAPAVVIASSLAVGTWSAAGVLTLRTPAGESVSIRVYMRTIGRDVPWMTLDGFLVGCTVATVVSVVGWTSGLAAAGAVRTSTTLFAGPLQMALVAIAPVLVAWFRRDAESVRSGATADGRLRTLRVLGAVSAAAALLAIAAAVTVTLLLPAVSAPGAPLDGVLLISAPAVIALGAGLWLASITTAYMRYRRPWTELMAVRVVTLVSSLSALVLSLAVLDLPVRTGVLVTAVPWALFPLAHAVTRWRSVTLIRPV